MKNTVSIYLGNAITFQKGDHVMVNATEMAKPFGKQIGHWLENASTKAFAESLARHRNSDLASLLIIKRGGSEQGTWMHEDLAIEFARWLSPEFGIWCNDKIKEIVQQGYAKLDSISRSQLAQMIMDAEAELEVANETIAIQAPKVAFVEEVFEAPTLLTMGEAAKMLGYGRNRLFAILRQKRILMMGLRQNEPFQTFIERGYFEFKGAKVGSRSAVRVVPQTFVTTRGLAWLRLNV